ncbi:hypothetical protein ABMA27_005801, partial [Loxostege sticticalis]
MGKRKNCEEEAKKIKRKLEKWKKRMKKNEEAREKEEEEINTPPDSPPRGDLSTAEPSTSKEDIMSIASEEDEIPDELLRALGPEGADTIQAGEPIHQHLASRWINIMRDGLKKDT